MSELKPCPFCGNRASLYTDAWHESDCFFVVKAFAGDPLSNAKAWNRRAPAPEQSMIFGDSGGGSDGSCQYCGTQGLHHCEKKPQAQAVPVAWIFPSALEFNGNDRTVTIFRLQHESIKTRIPLYTSPIPAVPAVPKGWHIRKRSETEYLLTRLKDMGAAVFSTDSGLVQECIVARLLEAMIAASPQQGVA